MESLKIYAYNGYIIIASLKEDPWQKNIFLIVDGSGTICKIQNSLGEAMTEIESRPPSTVEFKDEIPETLVDHGNQGFFIIAIFEDKKKKLFSVVDQLGVSQPEHFSTLSKARQMVNQLVKLTKKSSYRF